MLSGAVIDFDQLVSEIQIEDRVTRMTALLEAQRFWRQLLLRGRAVPKFILALTDMDEW